MQENNKDNITTSGVEKLENIEREVKREPSSAKERIIREKRNAEERVEKAKEKVVKKGKKAKKKKLTKEERKALAAKKREEKKKKLLAKKEERARKIEERRRALKEKREKRSEKRKGERKEKRTRERAPGFGGWLAAVIALGTVTLAMGTVLTAGALRMSDMTNAAAYAHMNNMYEFDEATDNIQVSLSKLKIASSPLEQSSLLSEVLVNSEIAEGDLERLPLSSQAAEIMNSFYNKTGAFAKNALEKLARGEKLSSEDKEVLNGLYRANTAMRLKIDELTRNMTLKDMLAMAMGKESEIERYLIEAMGGAYENGKDLNLEDIKVSSGAFAYLSGKREISSAEGEDIAKDILEDYAVCDIEFTGETTVKDFKCYNYTLKDCTDGEYYVQITKIGGALLSLNSYKPCDGDNYSERACVEIAEDFLDEVEYEDVEPVWVNTTGDTVEIRFAYVYGGVTVYSDLINVKVCKDRGIVTGVDAYQYLKNHKERERQNAKISEGQIREKLAATDIRNVKKAIIPLNGKDVFCYEANVYYDGEEYFVYYDANTGAEVYVKTVVNSERGRVLL